MNNTEKVENNVVKFLDNFYRIYNEYKSGKHYTSKDIEIVGVNKVVLINIKKNTTIIDDTLFFNVGKANYIENKLKEIVKGMRLNNHIDFIPTINFIERR
jgi:hypothetical protein